MPDEPAVACLRDDYDRVINAALSDLGVGEIRFVVRDPLDDIDGNAGKLNGAL